MWKSEALHKDESSLVNEFFTIKASWMKMRFCRLYSETCMDASQVSSVQIERFFHCFTCHPSVDSFLFFKNRRLLNNLSINCQEVKVSISVSA